MQTATDMKQFKYTWEEAIEVLRNDPEHHDLIFNSYLTRDLVENSRRKLDPGKNRFDQRLRLCRRQRLGDLWAGTVVVSRSALDAAAPGTSFPPVT